MINVLIFGASSGTKKIIKLLNKNIDIIAFVDNDRLKQGKKFMDKNIINPDEIGNVYYDYIIIGSMFFREISKQLIDLNVSKEKIVQVYKYGIDELKYAMSNINKNAEVIATGLSYMYYSLTINEMNKETINLASPNQDLYYDFNITKYILDLHNCKIKYAIIGLAYYSFQWDLSKTSFDYMCVKYNNVLNDSHNSMNSEMNIDEFNCFCNQSKHLFIKDFNNILVKDIFDEQWSIILDNENKKIGESQAQIHSKKIYKSTVEENVKVLENYLELLKEYDIKPILVVCPTSKYYYNFFPDWLKNEFYNILKCISLNYEFQLLDYFSSDKFEDCDFSDSSHLNMNGAKKFTAILNEDISW